MKIFRFGRLGRGRGGKDPHERSSVCGIREDPHVRDCGGERGNPHERYSVYVEGEGEPHVRDCGGERGDPQKRCSVLGGREGGLMEGAHKR